MRSFGDLPKSLETLCSQTPFINMKEMLVSFECCSDLMKTERVSLSIAGMVSLLACWLGKSVLVCILSCGHVI